jgi:hypothetical protein
MRSSEEAIECGKMCKSQSDIDELIDVRNQWQEDYDKEVENVKICLQNQVEYGTMIQFFNEAIAEGKKYIGGK